MNDLAAHKQRQNQTSSNTLTGINTTAVLITLRTRNVINRWKNRIRYLMDRMTNSANYFSWKRHGELTHHETPQQKKESEKAPCTPVLTMSGTRYQFFLYAWFLFVLVIIFLTSSSLNFTTDLFNLQLSGVRNPLILLLLMWILEHARHRFRNLPATGMEVPVGAIFAVLVLTTLLSSNVADSLYYLADTLLGIGFFYLSYETLCQRRNIIHVLTILLITGQVVVTFNIQYLTMNGFCNLGVLERYPFWTGKIPLGFYYAFLIAFLSGFLLYTWSSLVFYFKILLSILLAGSLISLFFSFTRGSWFTAIVIIIIAGIMQFGRKFLLLVMMIALFMSVYFHDTVTRLGYAVYNINSGNVDDRFNLWKSALDMLYDHPMTGVGPGTYAENYMQSYQLLESDRWNESYHAHNVFLHLAAEQGYPGLIAFLFFWAIVFRRIAMNFKLQSKHDRLFAGLNAALFLSLVNYFLWSLTNTSLGSVTRSFFNINMIIWFFAAMVIRLPTTMNTTTPQR